MGLGHARTYLKGYLMAIEKTFIMIKPDAVRDRKIGEIVARIERSGLVIERMEMTTLERATVEEHYAHLADNRLEPSVGDHGLFHCGCGWKSSVPDIGEWRRHMADAILAELAEVRERG